MVTFNLHLVSDATGETLQMVAKAAKTQFVGSETSEHSWPMIRSREQLEAVILGIQNNPGVVLCTLLNKELQRQLTGACKSLGVPCVDVIEPTLEALRSFLHVESQGQPGKQHLLDKQYYQRIDAMQFCLAHDDGQMIDELDDAEVVLVGVSRTSKTPTSMYLANRGIKVANVPLVHGIKPPCQLESLKVTTVVGLTNNVERLVELRLNRLKQLQETKETNYVNELVVQEEVAAARRYFNQQGWPIIDVTGRSIEETAATIIQLLSNQRIGL